MPKKDKSLIKASRIIFRCLPEDFELIHKAAALDGRKVTDFIRFHIKKAAQKIVTEEKQDLVFNSMPEQTEIMKSMFSATEAMRNQLLGKKS